MSQIAPLGFLEWILLAFPLEEFFFIHVLVHRTRCHALLVTCHKKHIPVWYNLHHLVQRQVQVLHERSDLPHKRLVAYHF